MKSKERLLRTLKGQEVDRLAWSPFLAYYWDFLDPAIQSKGQETYLQEIGADPLLRGFHTLFQIKHTHVEIRESIKNNKRIVIYETPIGSLTFTSIYADSSRTWFCCGHPVKTKEDFKILTYINEHMQILPDQHAFLHDAHRLGDDGLYIPVIGSELKTSFQSLLESWVGTENLIYALYDYPEVVEETLSVMQQRALETVKMSIDSPAEAFISWEDTSTTNISPSLFTQYIAPELKNWTHEIHKNNKLYIHHACGQIKDLLPHMSDTHIDAIESISPPPTGNITLWDARAKLPDSITLIGGIEPTVFLNSSMDALEQYTHDLITQMKGHRFVLANSDSCPPGVAHEKFTLISHLVRNLI